MPIRLTKITLRGYKSIKDLSEFEINPINVLIGVNGSGKSNFISFFRLLGWMTAAPGNLQEYINTNGFGSSFLYNGPAITPQIEANLEFEADLGVNEYAFRLFHAAPDTLIFADEKYRFSRPRPPDNARAPWISLGAGHGEAKIIQAAESENRTAQFILRFLNRCVVYQFHNTSKTARIRLGWSVTDNRYLKEDGANLASVLLWLRDERPGHYRRIVAAIRQVVPHFSDFAFNPSRDHILLQWRELYSDMIFGPHQASDGALRIMALFTLLLLPENNLPDVIVLDEPELGLHPYAIGVLAGLLKNLSYSSQIILATQSLNLLNYFEPEEIVVMDRVKGATTFTKHSSERLQEWLKEYSMAELWEKNVLGGIPK